jgi:hypothetical protein
MSGFLTTGKLVLTNTQGNQDAFDRLRVCNPVTIFEINHSIGKNTFLVDEIVSGSGATSKEHIDNSYIEMAISAGSTGKVVRQSYEYIPYQPGKSKLMIFSSVIETHGGLPNVISRIGCFDSSVEKLPGTGTGNGVFFELDGTALYAVIRLNDVDGERVIRSSWNYDKFDGLGPSGFTLTTSDFANARLFAIDMEWLGVGRVRFGFFINGQFYLGHSFDHSGIGGSSGITVPYTKTAKLPIRFELSCSSTAGLTGPEMRMICASIISEGGYDPSGMSFSIGRSTGVSWTNGQRFIARAIISIKLRNEDPHIRKSILLKSLTILNQSARSVQWDLYLFPDETHLTTPNWQNIDTNNSSAKYDITGTLATTTNGVLLDCGYADYSGGASFPYTKYLASPLVNSSINGTSRVLTLVAVNLTNNAVTVNGSLSWVEIS